MIIFKFFFFFFLTILTHIFLISLAPGEGKRRTNRQFRYEERDSDGNVHGHYGYLDGEGKMQVYNYSSHPEHGFHSQKSETLET